MPTKPSSDILSTRERILQEAATLFIQHGYTHTPISAIASKLGITKAALYYYFASKDELINELVSPLLDRVDEFLVQAPVIGAGPAGHRPLLLRYAEILQSDNRAAAILSGDVNVSTHPAIAPRIESHIHSLVSLFGGSSPDQEALVRVTAALNIVQRGLIFYAHEDAGIKEVPVRKRTAMLLELAYGILECRFADGLKLSEQAVAGQQNGDARPRAESPGILTAVKTARPPARTKPASKARRAAKESTAS